MRLIDADELIVMEYGGIKFVPEEFIKDAPTIEERKKGRWLWHENEEGWTYGFNCSACGEWYVFKFEKPKFCPNCGADMRGDV